VQKTEIILNAAWILVCFGALSAQVWRDGLRSAPGNRSLRLRRSLSVLIAALALFPVISASDDLHAMRAEMEESSPCKRSVCQAAVERVSVWHNPWQNPPAVVSVAASLGLISRGWHELFTVPLSAPVAPSILRASRAPPYSRLLT